MRCEVANLWPSNEARGYDKKWRALRSRILEAEPFCRECRRRGIQTAATMVDHIQSIREAPELRLDAKNLQPLCWRCHNAKTNRRDGGFGLGSKEGELRCGVVERDVPRPTPE